MFFRHSRIARRALFNSLLGLIIMFAVILGQSFFRNEHTNVVAMVTDQALREVITKGNYGMQNGVAWVSFIRMIVFALITIMFVASIDRTNTRERYVAYLVNFAVASFVIVFVLANAMGANQFKALISPITSLETANYLTYHGNALRISGFFHEPSHSSLFFGTALAALFVLRRGFFSRVRVIVILFVFFLMSRSMGILAVFIFALYFLYAPKWGALAALFASVFLQAILSFWAEYYATTGLFRSVNERSFRSEVYNATSQQWLVGFDFGQVYSFEPFVGLTLQIGILGLVGMYFILQREIRTFGFFIFAFSLTPQLWFYPAWGSVGVFMIALHAKELSDARRMNEKATRIRDKRASFALKLARKFNRPEYPESISGDGKIAI